MKQAYKNIEMRGATLDLVYAMNNIVAEYMRQGYTLTVRQLYYQLVARGIIENTERSYKRTTNIVNDARLCGVMDWDAIEDRTRDFIKRSHWESGAHILQSCAQGFYMDMWKDQDYRVFVIVEKEALAGILERVCRKWDIPLLPARGYPSSTVLREFCQSDLFDAADQSILILHLGDHDPSGIDMTRDLMERIDLFCEGRNDIEFRRVALMMEQIEQEQPPPNPAKVTDSRFDGYQKLYGNESWELDALRPDYLTNLVEEHVTPVIDFTAWDNRKIEIDSIKERIFKVAEDF